jgi:rubrerythrin
MNKDEILTRLFQIVNWDYNDGKIPNAGNLDISDYIDFVLGNAKEYVVKLTCYQCGTPLIDDLCPECDMRPPA